MTAAQMLAAEIQAEAAATRRVLERVPADRLTWRPHAKSMTLGQLAQHVAAIPGALTKMSSLDSFDANNASFTPPQPEDAATLVPMLEASIAEACAYLNGLSDATAAETWRLTLGDREVMQMPRLGVVRSLAMNHWYHHRGQLAVYLRLLDVPVPVIYGRSADENPFGGA
jgi:uncharacterized damage-inducible protein DinB